MAIRRSSLSAAAILPVGGPAGLPGQSAFSAWLALGNTGSPADFLASLRGADGSDGASAVAALLDATAAFRALNVADAAAQRGVLGAAALADLVGVAQDTLTALNSIQIAVTAEATRAQAAEALLATLASPSFTGTPTAPTAAAGTKTTQIATTAFVGAAVAAILGTAPTLLDTLQEIDAAINNDPNFATTLATQLATKAALDSPTFTGTPLVPTAAANANSTQVATTAYADRAAKAAPYIIAELVGATGYRKWSDGVIHQWGALTSTGGDSDVTLPTPFPTQCDRAFGGTNFVPDATAMYSVSVAPNGLTKVKVSPRITYGQSVAIFTAGAPLFWEAWGR